MTSRMLSASRRCRGVLFDLDDTLVPTSAIDKRAIHVAATRALGAAGSAAAAAAAARFADLLKTEPFPPADSEFDVSHWRSLLWTRALNVEATESTAVAPEAKAAFDTWSTERLDKFVLEDAVVAMVRRLQELGYKTGVLTNGHKDVQRAKTRACEAGALFGDAHVIIAGEHPEQKPHASVFRVACAALGEEPSAVVMVGDSYAADITGGINAGLLATVWVHPPDDDGSSLMYGHLAAVPAGQPAPTHTVGSVLELEAVLEQIG